MMRGNSCRLSPAPSRSSRGFTLLEMIVAVGIFSVIVLLATGAYLTLINLNRQIQATNTVVTNLSFVLENMARNIRTGTNYCTGVCTASSFSFVDSHGRTVTYSIDNAHALTRTIGATTEELTDPSTVTISLLRFYPSGMAKNDGLQPRVTVVIAGTAAASAGQTISFNIQTGATSRTIDL